MSRARDLANRTIASAALPKAGGAMTGAITTNSTFDGIDIATRDAVLTSTTTLATAAAPKASPAFTGTPTGITAAHLTGAAVLPAAVTGGSGLTAVPKAGVMTIKQIGNLIDFTSVGAVDQQTANSMDSTGFTISNLTITASNKLLCIAHIFVTLHGDNALYNRGYLRLTDGTNVSNTYAVNSNRAVANYYAITGAGSMVTIYHIFPYTSTTPTITIQTQCRHTGNNRTIELNDSYSTMQLFEIQV